MADQDDAEAAAREWLALLDAGEYQACWEGGSALMRGAVSPGQLAESLRSALEPLGAPHSRELDGAAYHETLPGAPDGRYWVMRFSLPPTRGSRRPRRVSRPRATATRGG